MILCCTNLKMTEMKIQNGYWQRPDSKSVNEKELKTLSLQKLYCNTEYWRLERWCEWLRGKDKSAWHVMGYWFHQQKYLPNTSPKLVTLPPVLKFLNPHQSSKFLLLPPTKNKKHEDVKLMHKAVIQLNS